jgi:hypothetical protein
MTTRIHRPGSINMLPRLSAQQRWEVAKRAWQLSKSPHVPAGLKLRLRRDASNLMKINEREAKRKE